MDKMAVRDKSNRHGEPPPVSALAGDSASAAWSDSLVAILMGRVARSKEPARRYWLRFLDAPLAKEFRDVGALDFDGLVDAVPGILRSSDVG